MTDTSAQHIAARDDLDLKARFIAVAEQAHVDNPEAFVQQNLGKLVSVEIGDETTVTAVHAYASSVYEQALAQLPPAPGKNPAAVTDTQLSQAVHAVWNA